MYWQAICLCYDLELVLWIMNKSNKSIVSRSIKLLFSGRKYIFFHSKTLGLILKKISIFKSSIVFVLHRAFLHVTACIFVNNCVHSVLCVAAAFLFTKISLLHLAQKKFGFFSTFFNTWWPLIFVYILCNYIRATKNGTGSLLVD